jgi:CubicO group peptidase (beta-lactamase class C family)
MRFPAALFMAMAGAQPAMAETGLAERIASIFVPAAESLLKETETPGMAVVVATRESTVYAGGIGRANLVTKAPVTAQSLFHWASVTKPFVGAAAMALVEDEKIELDAPVIAYLPYFTLADERFSAITVRHLLSHRSGMPDVIHYEWNKPVYDDDALERYVRGLGSKKLLFAPGSESKYSNMAYEVAGDVIAKASGESFEAFMANRLFTPLAMAHTTLLKAGADESLLVAPHTHTRARGTIERPHWPYNRMHGPSSTLISNAEDMARWIRMCLNRGILDGSRILSEASFDTMWTVQNGDESGEGLGWFIGEMRGHNALYHLGGDQGFRSALYLFPDDGIGLALAINSDKAPREALIALALDSVLGLEKQN